MCVLHRSAEADQKDPDAPNQPVSRVHVDYTVKSGPERLQAVLPDEAERLMKTPFAVIQVTTLHHRLPYKSVNHCFTMGCLISPSITAVHYVNNPYCVVVIGVNFDFRL